MEEALASKLLLSFNFNYWFLQTVAMCLTALFIPGLRVTSPLGALLAVIGLAYINSKVWDAALFFSVPDHFTLKTAALFLSNGIIFWILVKLLPGIEVDGLLPALIAPLVFTFTSVFISEYAKDVDWPAVFEKGAEYFRQVRDYFLVVSSQTAVAPTPTPH